MHQQRVLRGSVLHLHEPAPGRWEQSSQGMGICAQPLLSTHFENTAFIVLSCFTYIYMHMYIFLFSVLSMSLVNCSLDKEVKYLQDCTTNFFLWLKTDDFFTLQKNSQGLNRRSELVSKPYMSQYWHRISSCVFKKLTIPLYCLCYLDSIHYFTFLY